MPARIDVSEEAGVRYLHFGSSWIQGAMRIARPWSLELDYTRDMMAALLLREHARFPRKVLVVGLGAASVSKFIYRNRPRAQVCTVEIDPQVVAAARQFFKLPADDPPRFVVQVADGVEHVARFDRALDLLMVDGFDTRGRAGALDDTPFYLQARRALTDRGVLVVNLLGRSRGYKPSVARIAAAFDDRVVTLQCEGGNVIAFAAVGEAIDRSFRELREAAALLREQSGLNLLPTLARLAASPARRPGDRLVL
jgi:spermidine synthase